MKKKLVFSFTFIFFAAIMFVNSKAINTQQSNNKSVEAILETVKAGSDGLNNGRKKKLFRKCCIYKEDNYCSYTQCD